jgi:peptidoglycan/xylan/chitin deacetylase (PgdA/CDA1 family)
MPPNRDFRGYGQKIPNAAWPNGARVAVSIVVNYEEGSERTPLEGDAVRETSAEATYATTAGDRELIQESTFEYASRAGHWRLHRLLTDYGIRATVFACGMALERNPEYARAIGEGPFDIVGHGYRWIPHYGLTANEERENISRNVEVVRELTGREVHGWFTRPLPTEGTRSILAAEGISYDCTAVNDDLPYYADVDGRPMLIVPYSLDANDVRFWKGPVFTAGQFHEYLRDAFEVLYEEGAERPRMMSVGLHGRISGRPGRVLGIRRFLDDILGRERVWIAGRDEIARHWQSLYAPPEAWNPIPE